MPRSKKSLRTQNSTDAALPEIPAQFKTAAEVVRFKKAQRRHDQALLAQNPSHRDEVQRRNSIAPPNARIRILELERTPQRAAAVDQPLKATRKRVRTVRASRSRSKAGT